MGKKSDDQCNKCKQFLEIKPMASFSGSLMFHTMYPWPQRPSGLVDAGFKELAKDGFLS